MSLADEDVDSVSRPSCGSHSLSPTGGRRCRSGSTCLWTSIKPLRMSHIPVNPFKITKENLERSLFVSSNLLVYFFLYSLIRSSSCMNSESVCESIKACLCWDGSGGAAVRFLSGRWRLTQAGTGLDLHQLQLINAD